MRDQDKTKKQLLLEIAELRQRVAALEVGGRGEAEPGHPSAVPANFQAAQERDRLEAILSATLDCLPVDFFTLGPDGRYMLQNAISREHIGDAVGKRPEDICSDQATLNVWHEYDRRAFAGERVAGEMEIVLGDKRRDCYSVVAPIRDARNFYGIVGITVDTTALKRAEAALQQTEQRARQYLDVAAIIMVVLDIDGKVALLNHKGYEILGYPEGTLVGRNWFSTCVPERVREVALSAFRKLIAGELEPVEYFENPVVIRSGQERIIAWHNALLTDESGQVVGTLSSGTDITDQKRAEEALREGENRYRLLAEAIPQPVWHFSAEGELVDCSRRWTEYTGQPADEARGDGWMKMVHRDDLDQVLERIQEAGATGRFYQAEHRLRRASDGSYRWHVARALPLKDKDGKITGWFGSATDVDDRKQAEEALRESEERYRTLAESTRDIIYILDRQGTLLCANQAALASVGLSRSEIVGKGQRDLFPPEVAEKHLERIKRVFETGEAGEADELFQFGSEEIWLNVRTIPLRDERGQIILAMGVCRNITDRKQAEEALQKAHDELEQRVQERTAELAKANEDLAIFRRFAEASGEGFGMADLDGRITYVNPTLCRLFGEERPEDAIGKHVSTYYSEEYVHRRAKEILPLLSREGRWQGEESIRSRDGRRIPILQSSFLIRDENGNPYRIAAAINDITERKRAEEALRQSHDELRVIYDGMVDGLLALKQANPSWLYRFTLAPRRVQNLFGPHTIGVRH